jgi:hypothetical protein
MEERASPEAANVGEAAGETPAGQTPAREPPARATPEDASLAEPLLRHYLLAVASCGAYLLFRAYLVARRLDAPSRASRARALVWPAALLFAPAACAYLYEVTRLSRLESAARGAPRARRPLLAAPLLYAAIGLALLASPAAPLWSPLLLLLPLPFLLVQAEINALEAARAAAAARGPAAAPPAAPAPAWPPARRAVPIIAAALLPVTAFVVWRLDRDTASSLKTSRRLAAGAVVADKAAQFSLRVPTRGWEQIGPGGVGDGSEEFALRSQRGEVWVVVYTQPMANSSLDDVVAYRRGLIREERATLHKIEEQRFFLEGADLVPASFVRYRMRYPRAWGSFQVLTTNVGDTYVEVVGFGLDGAETDVTKLVRSLRPGVQRS